MKDLDTLVRDGLPHLNSRAKRYKPTHEERQDLVARTLHVAARRFAAWNPERLAFSTWIYQIMRQEACEMLRRTRFQPRVDQLQPAHIEHLGARPALPAPTKCINVKPRGNRRAKV